MLNFMIKKVQEGLKITSKEVRGHRDMPKSLKCLNPNNIRLSNTHSCESVSDTMLILVEVMLKFVFLYLVWLKVKY